jgi:hypothetical protein
MKKAIFLSLTGFLIGLLILSCENEEQALTGRIIANSGCKSSKSDNGANYTPDTLSCINYIYEDSSKKLLIKHINAGFNCCLTNLYCNVTMSGDTVIIKEYEKSLLCRCNCLYDLEIEITGIISKKYQVKFIEPYSGKQEKIIFEMDLENYHEGSYCVIRKQYPWV